jgi:Anti-sigma factor NepR
MPKRTLDELRYWSETNKIIGDQLRSYYQACSTEELPARLRAVLKKLENEEPEQPEQRTGIR